MYGPLPGQMFCPAIELTVCPRLAPGPEIGWRQSEPGADPEALHVYSQLDGVIWDAALRVLLLHHVPSRLGFKVNGVLLAFGRRRRGDGRAGCRLGDWAWSGLQL